MELEPIHEIWPDDLQLILNWIQEDWERLRESSVHILNGLADSIKKSLAFFFPDFADMILGIGDTNEAIHVMGVVMIYPYDEGIEAVRKIYRMLEDYQGPNDIQDMERAVKDYARISQHYFQLREMKKVAPLVKLGEQKNDQLHHPRQKKNKALLQYLRELQIRPSDSAESLFNRFPKKEKSKTIEGITLYRIEQENGENKILCVSPSGKITAIGSRAFANYFKAIKAEKHQGSKKV